MMRKILLTLFLPFCLLFPWNIAIADEISVVNVYFFWGEGCPHCEKETTFLQNLEKKNSAVKVYDFEISKNAENRKLLGEIANKLGVDVKGVPFTVVGENFFAGYYNDETTGKAIEDAVRCAQNEGCQDIGKDILLTDKKEEAVEDEANKIGGRAIPENIKVPILGDLSVKSLSLPLLTVVLGALDGFNPCAMWALLFLISLLVGMKNKRRMWIFGTVFIITSAAVYYAFMTAWLNFILFIGIVVWLRILVGLVALVGGGYNLREYFTNPQAACKISGSKKRRMFFDKLKNIIQQKGFYLALGGIILLAAAVNLVELICSAGLPAVYTQILAMSNLAKWQYYMYMLFYIFIFMLDDLFVFFAAMITLRATGMTSKYSHLSHLIGGVLMIIIGLLLILKPELLMFG